VIQVPTVQALNDHLPWISKVLEHADRFLIDSMRVIVLRECAIVHVGQLARYLAIVEQVVHVYLVDVTLVERPLVGRGQQRVQVALLTLEAEAGPEVVVIVFLCAFNAVWVQRALHPRVVEYLGDRDSLVWDQHEHPLNQVSRICRNFNWVLEVSLEYKCVQVLEV
jgi:hypothetical protein